MTIILDNGHGVNTSGKCSPDKSIREYEYNRRIAKAVAERLNEQGIKTYMLVPEVNDVPLATRVKRANDFYAVDKNCVLVSCHLNAASNGVWSNARGWSVWISNNASEKSKILAQCIYDEAVKLGLKGNRSTPADRVWRSNFYICKNTKMPAVLVEGLFQDNLEDAAFLKSERGFNICVNAYVYGILKYIKMVG